MFGVFTKSDRHGQARTKKKEKAFTELAPG